MFQAVYKTILKTFCELFSVSVSREKPSQPEAGKQTEVVSPTSIGTNVVTFPQTQGKIIKIAYMNHIDIQVVCSIREAPTGMQKTIQYLRKMNDY